MWFEWNKVLYIVYFTTTYQTKQQTMKPESEPLLPRYMQVFKSLNNEHNTLTFNNFISLID